MRDWPDGSDLFCSRQLRYLCNQYVRLKGGDPTDHAGIDLLRKLEKRGLSDAMEEIMISDYGDEEQTRKVFQECGVADFVF